MVGMNVSVGCGGGLGERWILCDARGRHTSPGSTPKGAAYNRKMLHALQQVSNTLQSWFAPALMARVTLLCNHVLASETVATARLLPHAGKSLRVLWAGVPAWLPPPPPMSWTITPAGLLEWRGMQVDEADLTLRLDGSRPDKLLSQMLSGAAPEAVVEGDAALAADVAWLMQNLRWDIAADLERVFPAAVAQGLTQALQALAKAARAALAPRS
jgi:ubiquinone biosynthesis accessory factor UbiJ